MTGSEKIIHFLSASDRINYGDLLFPLIFQFLSNDNDVKIYNYGIIKSDLSHFGAIPTKSYRAFQKNVQKYGGNVVVGGGEVLFVDWGSLYAFISFSYSKLLYRYKYNKFEKKYNFTRLLLSNGRVFVPFAPHRKELKSKRKLKIFYNAVGGTFSNSRLSNAKERFKESLLSSDYISVRDNRVKKSLSKHNIKSTVTPDSAIIISEIFPNDILIDKISLEPSEFDMDYIFLQIGKPYTPSDIKGFTRDLIEIGKELDCKLILCPIGLAPRHEDDIFLKALAKESNLFQFIMPQSIFDIMYLISNSKLFLGTSLHGLITAQSFQVPFIPLDTRVKKVEEYCKTWTFRNIEYCLPFNDLMKVISIYKTWDYKSASIEVDDQKKMVLKNFQHIYSSLI